MKKWISPVGSFLIEIRKLISTANQLAGLHIKVTPQTSALMKTSITTILYVCLNIVGYGLNNYFLELLWASSFNNKKTSQKQNYFAQTFLLFL